MAVAVAVCKIARVGNWRRVGPQRSGFSRENESRGESCAWIFCFRGGSRSHLPDKRDETRSPGEEMATDVNVIREMHGVHKTTRKDTLEPSAFAGTVRWPFSFGCLREFWLARAKTSPRIRTKRRREAKTRRAIAPKNARAHDKQRQRATGPVQYAPNKPTNVNPKNTPNSHPTTFNPHFYLLNRCFCSLLFREIRKFAISLPPPTAIFFANCVFPPGTKIKNVTSRIYPWTVSAKKSGRKNGKMKNCHRHALILAQLNHISGSDSGGLRRRNRVGRYRLRRFCLGICSTRGGGKVLVWTVSCWDCTWSIWLLFWC